MGRRPIPQELRETALRRLALSGPEKLAAVARECGVSRSTLREWWKEEQKRSGADSGASSGAPAAPPTAAPGDPLAAAEGEAAAQGLAPSPGATTGAAPGAPAVVSDAGPRLIALCDTASIMICRAFAVAHGVPWTDEIARKAPLTETEKNALAPVAEPAAQVLLPLLANSTKVSCVMFIGTFFLGTVSRLAFIRAAAPKKAPKPAAPVQVDEAVAPRNGHAVDPAAPFAGAFGVETPQPPADPPRPSAFPA